MPKLKDILKGPAAALPKSIEAQASGLPKLSNVLTSIANALPDGPDLPGFPNAMGKVSLPRVEEVFKGPKEAFSEVSTSLSATVKGLMPGQGGASNNNEQVKPAPAKAPALVFE